MAAASVWYTEKHMVFRCFSNRTLSVLQSALLQNGFKVYTLAGASIHDKRSLFEAFRRDVPADPPEPSLNLVWDAFTDKLGGGLAAQPDERVAILWLDAHKMLEGNMQLLVEAVECLSGEAENLVRPDHPIVLRVYLIGKGDNFPNCPGDWRPL
jgi:hypothetical protein